VEVNSSFYRPHGAATYTRWAASVPVGFKFAVKAPREITHHLLLVGALPALDAFLVAVAALGDALGPLLFQFPPRFAFVASVPDFFAALRERFAGPVVCEPRHPSWFADNVDTALAAMRIARVAADPAVVPRAGEPGGWDGLAYWRLHGAPRVYWSAYDPAFLSALAIHLAARATPCWCIFDNTARGAATGNALELREKLAARG
jgi:uncharacterized protein YecE (DUF72 family)